MIAEKAEESINQAVVYELQNIVKIYGATYASEHEGYAVLLEEVQESCEAAKYMQDHLEAVWSDIRNNALECIESDLCQVKNGL